MRKAVISFFAVMTFLAANSQDLPSWASGLKGADLKEAVRVNCNPKSFPEATNLFKTFLEIDVIDDGAFILNRFSENEIPIENNRADGVYYLYAVPMEWWPAWFDNKDKTSNDMHNMFLCEIDLISERKDFMPGIPEGEVYWSNGLWSVGEDSRTRGVWTFPKGYEGEMARAFLYMATIYPVDLWNGRGTMFMADGNYPSFTTSAIEYLLKYHQQNPPSQREIARNNYIEKIQGNPNPFVRWPELADLIWQSGEDNDQGGSSPLPSNPGNEDDNDDGNGEENTPDDNGGNNDEPGSNDNNGDDNAQEDNDDDDGDNNSNNNDDESSEPEPVPLKGLYTLEETLFLSSPFIPDNAEWKIDGEKCESKSVPCNHLGIGLHELRFKSDTMTGLITIRISQ